MKTKKAIVLIVIIFLITFCSTRLSSASHIKLLAVSEGETGYEGSVADLYLTIKPGSGRVFVEIFPLMKLDTQVSIRFAKEIACHEAEISCSGYDFFYTIRADSAIIGGPSASAAVAALTYAELKNLKIDEQKTVTGTINAGGIIGSVDGINAKLEAAAKEGLKMVLIPEGKNITTEINDTKNLSIEEYGKKLGIDVVEVSDLNEVMYELTGKEIKEFEGEIEINPFYSNIMRNISEKLCARSEELLKDVNKQKHELKNLERNTTKIGKYYDYIKEAENLTKKAEAEMRDSNFYSAASYCYGTNVKLRFLEKLIEKMNDSEMCAYADQIRAQIKGSYETLNRNYQTITALQTYVIVDSRLEEAEKYVKDALREIADEEFENAVYDLAYAEERTFSAELWKEFFNMPGKKFNFNEQNMKELCLSKIAEAEERYQYAAIFLKIPLLSAREKIEEAVIDSKQKRYEACFDKASRAKAESEVILSISEAGVDRTKRILEKRLEVIKKIIMRQGSKEMFPIAGFSYYEYANSLKDSDIGSAFIYSGYALELSSIDIYFQKKSPLLSPYRDVIRITLIFISGIAFGMLILICANRKIKEKTGIKRRIKKVKTKAKLIKNKKKNKKD